MRRSAGHQLATPLLRMSDPPAAGTLYAFGAATITKYDGAEQVELKTEILIPTTSTTDFVRRSRRSSTPTRRSTAKTHTPPTLRTLKVDQRKSVMSQKSQRVRRTVRRERGADRDSEGLGTQCNALRIQCTYATWYSVLSAQ